MSWENQQCGFWTGPIQTGLCYHRRWLEAGNSGFRKKRNCAICVVKTQALISFAVTAKRICAFVFRLCKMLIFLEYILKSDFLEKKNNKKTKNKYMYMYLRTGFKLAKKLRQKLLLFSKKFGRSLDLIGRFVSTLHFHFSLCSPAENCYSPALKKWGYTGFTLSFHRSVLRLFRPSVHNSITTHNLRTSC